MSADRPLETPSGPFTGRNGQGVGIGRVVISHAAPWHDPATQSMDACAAKEPKITRVRWQDHFEMVGQKHVRSGSILERDVRLDIGLVENHNPLIGMVLDLAAM